MTLFLDKINNILVEATNTKASKMLKKEYEEINNLYKLMDNYTNAFKSVEYDFTCLEITEKMTATKWVKNHLNTEENLII